MANLMINRKITDYQIDSILERIIDQIGLANTLDDIAEICREKADHLRTNWQDSYTARLWDRAGNRLDTQSAKANDSGL